MKLLTTLAVLLTLATGFAGAAPALAATPVPNPDNYIDGAAAPLDLAIGRMPAPPALDGSLADWPTDATTFLLGQNSQIGRRFNWGGTRDSSASIRLAWDASYLYLAADVIDNQLSQANAGAEPWQGDSLELFFNTYPRQQRIDSFFQESIMPALKPGAALKVTGPQKDFVGVEGATGLHPGGYTFECRIPWKNINMKPEAGAKLGFQVYLDDRDGVGRHAQLFWYPSAISFSRPMHTNIITFAERGDTTQPKVLAGPNTWCVTDPSTMNVSVIADVAGAKSATIVLVPTKPTAANATIPITIPIESLGDHAGVGSGAFPVTGMEGLATFSVTVTGATGAILATNTFQAELVGTRFQTMRAMDKALNGLVVGDLTLRKDLDPEALAGVHEWFTRVNAFVFNEARPEALNYALLDQMLTEYHGIDVAIRDVEAGKDPYSGRTGSFVRAYKSPLTGLYRPEALFVPADYDLKSTKRYPLIVLLHTIFADERQLSMLADQLKDLGAIVYQGSAYRQFDWGGVSAAETWAGLDDVKRHYRIDDNRVYLIGGHIGGRGTWQLAEARPDQFAAIAPLLSGIDTGPNYPALKMYPNFYAESVNVRIPSFVAPPQPAAITDPLEREFYEQDSLVTRVDNIATLPKHGSHGEDDPNAAAEEHALRVRLGSLGAPLTTHYVPGAMHGTQPDELRDPAFFKWLFSNTRPAYPKSVHFVATNLRDNSAWWVSIDQFDSPDHVARINACVTGNKVIVTASHAAAISLLLDKRLAPEALPLLVVVDGKPVTPALVDASGTHWVHLVKGADGAWKPGAVPSGQKRPGLSGPIDDFQRDRFIFVAGTLGDDAQKAAQLKQANKLADWGLGAVFSVKTDTDITDDDLKSATLILIGAPSTNTLIAKMADRLPIKWAATALTLGSATADGPGAGACLIVPNPLSPNRYAVILTATDDAGYQVWNARNPGGDYVLGHVVTAGGKPRFTPTARGWFTNDWQWSDALCSKGGE